MDAITEHVDNVGVDTWARAEAAEARARALATADPAGAAAALREAQNAAIDAEVALMPPTISVVIAP